VSDPARPVPPQSRSGDRTPTGNTERCYAYAHAVEDDDLWKVVDALRNRPGMMVPSPHFATIVAFLTGLDIGSGGRLLTNFNSWLGTPSIVWWGQIEHRVVGVDRPATADMVHRLADDDSKRCTEDLFTSLYAFHGRPT
jgi:hypothetical protein